MFFLTKARVFYIFVVIRGEGQSLESLWRHPTHHSYIRPARPFLTNLQAVRLCLRPVRTLHLSLPRKFSLCSKLPSSCWKLLLTAAHRGKAEFCCMFSEIRSSFPVDFRLENIYHRHRRKHKVESRFVRETTDCMRAYWDSMTLL